MGNLLGSPFRDYVNNQVKIRQQVHGSGTKNSNRTLDEIAYLNSRNAWVKFASAVYINEERLQLLRNQSNPMVEGVAEGFDLAIKNVLFNGLTPFASDSYSSYDAPIFTEALEANNRNSFKNAASKFVNYTSNFDISGIEGFDPHGKPLNTGAYGVGGRDFGFSPMPGITSVNIKDLNRGSIKKATINIKAHNRNQFDVIDLLYLRLGYTVCLEFGNNIYFDYEPEGSDTRVLKKVEDTLIDRYFWTTINESYASFLDKINEKRKEYKGNYDGIIGVISNFNWSFENDGTYNITLEVTSVGDVIESLKVNLPPLIDIATSANVQNKYEALKNELANRRAKKEEFYDTLYPGLEGQLREIYQNITEGGTTSPFNFTREGIRATLSYKSTITSSPPKLLVDPEQIQPIQDFDNKTFISDSIISKDINWILNFYSIFPANGLGVNDNPLNGGIKILYFKDNKVEKTETFSSGDDKPSWLDNSTQDFRTKNPDYDFYVVVGGQRNTSRTFSPFLGGLFYYRSETLGVDQDELDEKETFYFSQLTPEQQDSAFPEIFTEDNFLQRFYDSATMGEFGINLPKGGKKDENFNSSNTGEEKSPLEIFRERLETGKYKNKINNWFYNIRIYYEFLFSDIINKEVPDTLIDNLPKIELSGDGFFKENTTEGRQIGYRLNPYQYNKKWEEKVGFPSSSGTNNRTTCDIVKLKINPIEHSYFIRLGTLLQFIQDKIIMKVNGKYPYLRIDTDIETNICYTVDNMISVNIKKCLIKNSEFFTRISNPESSKNIGIAKLFVGLEDFQSDLINGQYLYGKIMNIYLNFNRVEEIFNSVDKNNQISLFEVLKAICDDINESLGSVNNIEPVIDKEKNTVKLIDQTSIPGLDEIAPSLGDEYIERKSKKENQIPLEVFGYNTHIDVIGGTGKSIGEDTSNFIRSVGMTTEISKNYATAITIGATAQGEVPGMEATAFSRWNIGIRDRFKSSLFDAESEDTNPTGSLDKQNEAVLQNYKDFAKDKYVTLGLNFNGDNTITINDNYISENKNTVKNYYVYAQAKTTEENYKEFGNDGAIESSIGFLPINLKLEMDGLGGIRIYDYIKINTSFLPSNYPNTLEFICTGVNHKLENNEWVTSLDTLATSISKTKI